MAGALAAALTAASRRASADIASSLKDLAKARGLLYGSSVSASQLTSDRDFVALLLAQCACVTPEAEMKWGEMIDATGKENYTGPDTVADFAAKHGLALRGHALIWYRNTPDWFKDLSGRKTAEAAMLQRIADMCTRYRGRVFCWDVANEAINVEDGRPDGLRKAVFLDHIGPDYIDLAHHAARAADPGAKLVVNDYGIEYDTPDHDQKRAAVLRLLERMKKAGTPVDALGVQAHLQTGGLPFSQAKLRQFFAEIAAMGLDIHITELDVADNRAPAFRFMRDQFVAEHYARFLEAALVEPAVNVVVTWGLSDRYTWLNSNETSSEFRRTDGQASRPLPFDNDLVQKPAWNALAQAFQNAPARTNPVRPLVKPNLP
jgi:endo-1,4-beta-xylanase